MVDPIDLTDDIIDAEMDAGGVRAPARSRRAPDPWAHRRGEPRLFAFLWTLYLFVTVLGSLLWLTRSGVLAASAYGPAARIMLIVIAAGATLLWPMIRLSQLAPSGGIPTSVFSDLIVIVMPVQVVVWPLAFLANWPIRVVAVLAGMLLAWPALIGGLIALAQAISRRSRFGEMSAMARVAWMLVCLVVVAVGPVVVAVSGSGEQIDISSWAWKLSPFTFVFVLTGTGLRGPHAPIGVSDWLALAPVAVGAGAVWLTAALVARRGRPDAGPPAGRPKGGDPEEVGRGGPGAATSLDSPTNSTFPTILPK